MSLCAVVDRGWLFGDNDIVNGYPLFFYQVNGGETVYANCHHTHTHIHTCIDSIKEHMVAMMMCV